LGMARRLPLLAGVRQHRLGHRTTHYARPFARHGSRPARPGVQSTDATQGGRPLLRTGGDSNTGPGTKDTERQRWRAPGQRAHFEVISKSGAQDAKGGRGALCQTWASDFRFPIPGTIFPVTFTKVQRSASSSHTTEASCAISRILSSKAIPPKLFRNPDVPWPVGYRLIQLAVWRSIIEHYRLPRKAPELVSC